MGANRWSNWDQSMAASDWQEPMDGVTTSWVKRPMASIQVGFNPWPSGSGRPGAGVARGCPARAAQSSGRRESAAATSLS